MRAFAGIRGEEPDPVLSAKQLREEHRTSQSCSELVALELGTSSGVKEVARIQAGVPMKPECGAVKLIASASGNHAELAAGTDAIFRVVQTCLHFEFLQCIRAGQQCQLSVAECERAAIKQDYIVRRTIASHI